MAGSALFKGESVNLMALQAVRKAGGILGESIPPMMWNAVVLCCVEVPNFIGFYKISSKKYEGENGFEIRCTGNST
jgi:hypothetical protein